jgi:hypothetical protein
LSVYKAKWTTNSENTRQNVTLYPEKPRLQRPCGGAAITACGRQTRRQARSFRCGSNFAGRHTLQNEHKFVSFYCEFRGTYTPSGVKKRERGIQIFTEIPHFMVKTAFMSHHGLRIKSYRQVRTAFK